MKKNVRSHKFNGKKYFIDIDTDYAGFCENPNVKKILNEHPVIRIVEGLPYNNDKGSKEGLIYILHECLHAENWSKHEETIDRTAEEVGSLFWRLGYRRIK